MSTHPLLCTPFLALLLIAGTSCAQQSPAASKPPASRITLDAVVTDRSGHPIAGLQQPDFSLTDNKAVQPITSFRALGRSQEPVEVILVVDTVNASYHTVSYEREEIEKFLHTEGSQLAYPTSLAIVTDTGTEAANGFSKDGGQLSTMLDKYTVALRTINRGTGIYGADERFTLSLTALQTIAAKVAPLPGRKIILWISPGWPLLSGPRIELSNRQEQQIFGNIVGLSTQLRQGRITLYSVDPIGAGESILRANYYKTFLKGVEKPSQVDAGDLALQVIATQTGGLALNSSNDVAALLRQCYSDANNYYELSFDAPPADRQNEYHHLQLQVSHPDLSVRTIQGYYNQPAAQTASGTPQ